MNHLSLTVALFVAGSSSAAPSEVSTISRFYRIMKATRPTIADFTDLFGNDSEAELDAILAVHYPAAVDPGTSKPILKFTRERLANRGHASEFLGCIRRLRPKIFSPRSMPKIERVTAAPNDDSFTRVVARTTGGNVVFLFSRHAATIEDIEMPDGVSVYALIPECGRHLRRSGSPP